MLSKWAVDTEVIIEEIRRAVAYVVHENENNFEDFLKLNKRND